MATIYMMIWSKVVEPLIQTGERLLSKHHNWYLTDFQIQSQH